MQLARGVSSTVNRRCVACLPLAAHHAASVRHAGTVPCPRQAACRAPAIAAPAGLMQSNIRRMTTVPRAASALTPTVPDDRIPVTVGAFAALRSHGPPMMAALDKNTTEFQLHLLQRGA